MSVFLRVLVLLVLIVVGWWILRKRTRAVPPPPAPPAPAIAKAEPMVDCAHCGLHLPASEALRDEAERRYCCVEHRVAGPRRPG